MKTLVTEAYIHECLDGTFTHIDGQRDLVPLDFIPSHEPIQGNYQGGPHLSEGEALSILQHVRAGSSCIATARHLQFELL